MKECIVIENFYEDPDKIRDFALSKVKYLNPNSRPKDFVGTESIKGIYNESIVKRFEKAIGESIEVDPQKYAFGVFSKTYESDNSKKLIHVDGSEWTAIIYLSKKSDPYAGTHLWEHLPTGWTAIPNSNDLNKLNYSSRQDFIDRELVITNQNPERWKPHIRVGYEFNRLVLLRSGKLFHSAGLYFGTDDESCRLTQLFFFNTKNFNSSGGSSECARYR